MREIKFRVWDKKDKLWVAGWSIGQAGVQTETSNKVFMQYTGLKDKNGKEIYEGDVIEINLGFDFLNKNVAKPKKLVMFNEERARFEPFAFQQIDGSIKRTGYFGLEEYCEVIGNLYENPELLDK